MGLAKGVGLKMSNSRPLGFLLTPLAHLVHSNVAQGCFGTEFKVLGFRKSGSGIGAKGLMKYMGFMRTAEKESGN